MELTIFARFHAREGEGANVETALREQVPYARGEPGCLGIEAYRSTRDPGCSPSTRAGAARRHSTSMPNDRAPSGSWSGWKP